MSTGAIDIHCHIAGIGAGASGCRVSPALRQSWKFGVYLRAFGVSQRELQAQGDQLVVDRLAASLAAAQRVEQAVLLALDAVVDSSGSPDPEGSELYIPNEFVQQACARYPQFLYGASVHPGRRDWAERLDAAAAGGAVLLKWLPAIQGIDPADRRHIPFYRRLVELGLPLLSHTGHEDSFTRADNRLADPERLRLPLEAGVTVIAAHCASSGASDGEPNLRRFLRLAGEFPHLCGDVSALTQVNRRGHLQQLLARPELAGRLFYGSDMPLPRTGLTSSWFQLGRLSCAEILRLQQIAHPWDRNVAQFLALGLPPAALTDCRRVLRL